MSSKPRITRSSNVKNVIALEKSKQCIVRLEDIKRHQKSALRNSSTPQQQKGRPKTAVQSATKKTPFQQKILPKMPQSAPPRQQSHNVKKKQIPDDDLDSNIDTSSFGRSRRTPKPNFKYYNDSVVTAKSGKKAKVDDEEDEVSSDIDFEEKDDNASDFDISEEEDVPPAKKTRLSTSLAVTATKKQSLIVTPPMRRGIIPVQKMMVKKPTVVEKPIAPSTSNKKVSGIITFTSSNRNVAASSSRKRPLETTSTTSQKTVTTVQKQTNFQPIRPKPPSMTTNNNSSSSSSKAYTILRKSTGSVPRPPPSTVRSTPSRTTVSAGRFAQSTVARSSPSSSVSRPSQSTVARSTPSSVSRPSQSTVARSTPSSVSRPSQSTVARSTSSVEPRSTPSAVTRPTSSASTRSTTSTVTRSTASTVPQKQQKSATIVKKEEKKSAPSPQIKTSPSAKPQPEAINDSSIDEDNLEEDIENPMALNTIDDFEAMPTFTIVNINDIINKKGDVLMQQPFPSFDEKKAEDKQENITKNRRKATHTVLKEEPSTKSPPPKTPFPPVLMKKVGTPASTGPLKQIVMNKKAAISPPTSLPPPPNKPLVQQKPPMRILNSTLCRQQAQVSPIINAQKQQQQSQLKITQSIVKSPSSTSTIVTKEHQVSGVKKVVSPVKTVVNNNNQRPTVTPPLALKRKLPEEKITVQKQGTKTIKKMTCFENWYVVHCAEKTALQKPPPKQLTLPLIKIANNLQDICLPSEKWTSKVALSLIPDSVYQRGLIEKYTGHYHDKSLIKDEIKHRYQPASILFRRSQKPNMIDRTVILKNRTFLIYIQGKSVQLLGSPSFIRDMQDIESLLDCVDHLELNSDDVDVTPTTNSSA